MTMTISDNSNAFFGPEAPGMPFTKSVTVPTDSYSDAPTELIFMFGTPTEPTELTYTLTLGNGRTVTYNAGTHGSEGRFLVKESTIGMNYFELEGSGLSVDH